MKPIVAALLCTLVACETLADAPTPPPAPGAGRVSVGREDSAARWRQVERHCVHAAGAEGARSLRLHVDAVHLAELSRPRHLFRRARLSVPDGRRSRSWQLRGRVPAADPGSARRSRRGRMARAAAVLQRQGHDVGRLVCGLRPVGHGQGISAASGDDRAGGVAVRGHRLSDAREHCLALSHAMAHVHQRPCIAGSHLRRRGVLACEEPPVVRVG